MRAGPVPGLGAALHARRRRRPARRSAWSGRAGSPRPSPAGASGSGCRSSITAAGPSPELEALGAARRRARRAAGRERLRQPARPALARDPPPDRRPGPGPDEADGLPDQHGAGAGGRRGGAGRGAARPGRIAGAGLDVYEDEPRMAAGPRRLPEHGPAAASGQRHASRPARAMSRIAAENLVAALEGRRPPNLVNPEALAARPPRPRPVPETGRSDGLAPPVLPIGTRSHGRAQVPPDSRPIWRAGSPTSARRTSPGLDRTPGRLGVEFRPGLMTCHREATESGRLSSPGRSTASATPIVGTATLAERAEPYDLAVELARGKLNDVRNQLADWRQMGLRCPPSSTTSWSSPRRPFVRAATSRDQPEPSRSRAAQASLRPSLRGRPTSWSSPTRRRSSRPGWTTRPSCRRQLGCGLDGDPKAAPWRRKLAARPSTPAGSAAPGRSLAPDRGEAPLGRRSTPSSPGAASRADRPGRPADRVPPRRPARLALALGGRLRRRSWPGRRLRPPGGRPLPRQGRRPGTWSTGRPARHPRALRGGADPDRPPGSPGRPPGRPRAQFIVGVDRPWAEWMASSPFQLGPLHLADYLARADLGLAGIGLEIAPGYSAPGSHIRDLFDFSRLLDLYALLNLPLTSRSRCPRRPARPAGRPRVQVETPPVARAARRGDPGRMGRAMGRPGRRQAVRPLRHLAPGRRRRPPSIPPRGPLPPRRRPEARLRLASELSRADRAPPIPRGER